MSLNLSPGEQLIFQGHPCWRAILGFYLKGILVAAIAGVIAKLVGAGGGTVFLVVLVVIGLTVLIGFVKRVATTYTITNRRLNIKRGIVSREVQETRLERVQNVNYRQSAYQRIMQIGDVDFDTAATDDYNFVFAGVADPGEVVHRDARPGRGATSRRVIPSASLRPRSLACRARHAPCVLDLLGSPAPGLTRMPSRLPMPHAVRLRGLSSPR
jgi:membrane protein YdbS with pleckstrin-like domain